jgi:demethylmenaquinone methyltransferase/2-methoxy-6-polyprenyl-1,4-benzoquinol methylase
MNSISAAEKYSQPDVVTCWQNLSQQGLQQAEWVMVNRYFKPGQTVLDVGCGAGRAVLALNKAGYTMTGIDLSLPMLKAGRTLSPPARLGGANLLNLPFAGGSFEAGLMFFGALQHIRGQGNRQQALTEMARVTQSGGVLILGLDN